MALYHRSQTGQGQSVEVPMLETMLAFNLVEHLWTGGYDEPMGPLGYSRALMAERRPFETRDGEICLMATSDLQWSRLLCTIGLPELSEDVRFSTLATRSAHFPELYAHIAVALRKRDTVEWQALLDASEIPNAPIRHLSDMPTDPYLTETGFFHRYRHPTAGPLVTPGISVKYSETPATIRMPPPCLGEHSEEILTEFGFSGQEIAALVDRAAVSLQEHHGR
jgi:crotonobetainyl-CoA:carnitine CoA-transferase CaiB-like acyl-CoA transferase